MNKVRPAVPIDLLMEQTLSPDNETASSSNDEEFLRCRERFMFLKWVSTTFLNVRVVPPSSNVVHQASLESLSSLTCTKPDSSIVPDIVVGIDSHIAMHNGFGTLAWSKLLFLSDVCFFFRCTFRTAVSLRGSSLPLPYVLYAAYACVPCMLH